MVYTPLLARIDQFPLLSGEEEYALAKRFHSEQDLNAAQQLVLSHMRYVAYIARTYQGYGLALNDLIQEGAVGLMKAVKGFNPDRGVRLITYATVWIKSEIQEFVIRHWRIVKMATTKAQRKLFFNLRARKTDLKWLSLEEQQQFAAQLQVPLTEVQEMEARLYSPDYSFEGPQAGEEQEGCSSPAQLLAAPASEEPLQQVLAGDQRSQAQRLSQALAQLDERTRTIIQARWLSPEAEALTLKVLALELGISLERVRQLEQKGFALLKEQLYSS